MGRMLLGWWLESFVSAVQKPTQLQILRRVPDGAHQARQHIIGEVVVLLQSGVSELKKSHQDVLRPPLRWGLFHIRAKPAMLPLGPGILSMKVREGADMIRTKETLTRTLRPI